VDCGRLRVTHHPGPDGGVGTRAGVGPGGSDVDSDDGGGPPDSDRDRPAPADCECARDRWTVIEDPGVEVTDPDLEQVLRTVFGVSPLGIEVCLWLMDAGEASSREVADAVEADRSTVVRHLKHLSAVGVLDADQRIHPDGGRVTVFRTEPAEVVRRRFAVGLYAWMAVAVRLVDDLTEEKLRDIGQTWVDGQHDDDPGDSANRRDRTRDSDDVYYTPDG
jgi:predicted transcriptional regulator